MKKLALILLLAGQAMATDFSLLTLNSDLTLPTWATNFFTANAGYIPASGAATTIATNGGTGWGTTLISPYSSGGTNSTPTILQPTLYDDITLAELTASRVLTTDASKILSASSVTTTELGYLSGVTSAVQTQLTAKAPLVSPSFTTPSLGSATATTIAFTDSAVTVAANSTNGSSGFLFNITGASGALMRFRTNTTTTHTFYADGTAAFTGSSLTLNGVVVAKAPAVETLSYSGSDVTVTAGKGPLQRSLLTCTNNFNLIFASGAQNDGGTIYVAPAATNCTVTLASNTFGPSGTTLTISGGTGNTNFTKIAWECDVIGGTNRFAISALNYYR